MTIYYIFIRRSDSSTHSQDDEYGEFRSFEEAEEWLLGNGWEKEAGNSWFIRLPKLLFVSIGTRIVPQTKPIQRLLLRMKEGC